MARLTHPNPAGEISTAGNGSLSALSLIPVTIQRVVDPCEDLSWERLVTTAPSTLFHSPQWMRLIRDTYDYYFKAMVIEGRTGPVAGVPYAVINEFGSQRRISLPFSDFCGVLSQNPSDATALTEEMISTDTPWTLKTLTGTLPRVAQAPSKTVAYKWHGIAIDKDPACMLAERGKSVRRAVRRAERDGVSVVQADSKEQLRAWFLVHLRLRKLKHGVLVQPYEFFERLWDTFIEPGNGFLLLAMYEGEIIAGEIDIVWQDVLYSKFAASLPEHAGLRANHLLVWTAIEEARRRNCVMYDMGRTRATQEGLVYFKRSLGAEEEDLVAVTYGSEFAQAPGMERLNKTVVGLSHILAQPGVPDELSERGGELLYRYFA